MEAKTQKLCEICQKELKTAQISSTCNHSFCFKCYPYFLFNKLKSSGIHKQFFESPDTEYSCVICGTGQTSFPYDELIKKFNEETFSFEESKCQETTNKLCDGCEEKSSESFCLDCSRNYCEECLEQIHKPKKFQIHKISCLEQMEALKQPLVGIREMKINALIKNFGDLSEVFLMKVDALRKIYHEKFNKCIEKMINDLKLLKLNNEEKSSMEFGFLNAQMQLIKSSLLLMKKQMSLNRSNLHTNEQFNLDKLFDNIEEKKMLLQIDWEADYDENLKEIQEITTLVSNMKIKGGSQNNRLMKLIGNDKIKIGRDLYDLNEEIFNNFKTNPIELLKETEFLLESNSLDYGWSKSNLSCSFLLNEESFLSWAGYSQGFFQKTYPLIIYNVSLMKREAILQQDNKYPITLVSTYPKDDISFFNKKWLYCADEQGILRIYELSCEKTFKLECLIDTNLGKAIVSAMIFHDKFKELYETKEKDELSYCYLMMTFNEALTPIYLYKNIKDSSSNQTKWNIFRKITNPANKLCYTMNFYYDESVNKTIFLFGFSESHIKIYDLDANKWENTEFETKNSVSSINFIFRKKNPSNIRFFQSFESQIESFLIYSQRANNILTIGNMKTRKIVRKVDLPKVSDINDCCVWNSSNENSENVSYFLVSTYDLHSIHILDFENLNVLFIKKLEKFPVNLIKILKKVGEKNQKSYQESLSCVFEYANTSKIVIWEGKKLKEERIIDYTVV